MPDISVIVPHYNDLARLSACLDALERQSLPRDRYEIIVADNGSPVGPDAVATAVAGRARLVFVATPGAGPARNGGVVAAEGRILAFTDSDCVPDDGWLAAGVEAVAPGTPVGGAMRVLVGDPRAMTGAEAYETVFAFDNETYVKARHFTVTANLFVLAEDFARVGDFRTGVSEDIEWCLRARDRGLALRYAGDAVVGHPARRTWPELRRKWERLMAERYALAREREGRLHWLLWNWAIPLSTPASLLTLMRSRSVPRLRDRAKAAAILVRLRLCRLWWAHRVMLERP
jgi:glycosyltransferase involved in cell wall biosynthesis